MSWIAKYWVEVLFGAISAGMGLLGRHLWKKVKVAVTEQQSTKNGITALLRDRIIQAYSHHNDKGYYPIYARDNVNALYKEYRALGGNGTVSDLMKELQTLPIEKQEV